MSWLRKNIKADKKVKIPEGLWVKCNNCREIIYRKEVDNNYKTCPKCNYHFPLALAERISISLDEGSFQEMYANIKSQDSLNFKDTQKYSDRLKTYQEKTGQYDGYVVGTGQLLNRPLVFGVLNFAFMGGSMGSVTGEKVTLGAEYALKHRLPYIIISSSGGARMQEGILSLMQMAKTSAAIGRMKSNGVPFISMLTDPTFGGVTASFAMLGDIIIAEPKALIGFAGARVIEQTIKQQLPDGFQRAEFMLAHGMIDMLLERKNFKTQIASLIDFFNN